MKKISIEEYMNSKVATEKEKKDYHDFMDYLNKELEKQKKEDKQNEWLRISNMCYL